MPQKNNNKIQCHIEWNALPLAVWEEKFAQIRRSNLLQSYEYARVLCRLHRQRARWGLIRINDKEAGLVQILEVGILRNLVHTLLLDRGALWFEGYGSPEDVVAFFTTIAKTFPARFLRGRRILPELPDTEFNRKALEDLRYKRLPRQGYETIWLDIEQPDDTLRAQLKGKWRNRLNVAEKAEFAIDWDWTGKDLGFLLKQYEADKASKGFQSASSALLIALAKGFLPRKKMLIGTARLGDTPVGIVLFFLHGSSATYQTGWASALGKNHSAHNILLWQACAVLRQAGIKDLDLGGVNDAGAAGVKAFKEGMGGELVRYVGQYS